MSWQAGVDGLRDKRTYAVGGWKPGKAFEGLSDPPKLGTPKTLVGRSELLGKR